METPSFSIVFKGNAPLSGEHKSSLAEGMLNLAVPEIVIWRTPDGKALTAKELFLADVAMDESSLRVTVRPRMSVFMRECFVSPDEMARFRVERPFASLLAKLSSIFFPGAHVKACERAVEASAAIRAGELLDSHLSNLRTAFGDSFFVSLTTGGEG